jgi:alcohol dehydrogenase (NADP+)
MGWSLLGKTVTGSLIGSPKEIEDMFKLGREEHPPWIETRPMNQATQTVNDMYAGKAKFRYVLVN